MTITMTIYYDHYDDHYDDYYYDHYYDHYDDHFYDCNVKMMLRGGGAEVNSLPAAGISWQVLLFESIPSNKQNWRQKYVFEKGLAGGAIAITNKNNKEIILKRDELEELLQAGDVDQDGLLNISEFG